MEIRGIGLQGKNKFFPLPKLFKDKKESIFSPRKISNIEANMINIENNKNYSELDLLSQMQGTEKNYNDRFFYDSITSGFSINRNLLSQGDSVANEYCKNDNFSTKLKSISRQLPKQKNYAFYSKEPASFKNLKQLNKTKRSSMEDFKNLEGQLNPKALDECYTQYSKNFLPKNKEKLKSLSKGKEFNSDDSKNKDINIVKNHFRILEKSKKIKNLGYVHKKQKIESIRHKDNIGQKFIDYFENKQTIHKNELDNDSEVSNEEENFGHKYNFDSKTSEEKHCFEDNKENGFIDVFEKLKSDEFTRNLVSSDRKPGNNLNAIDGANKDQLFFYSSSNISNIRNSELNLSYTKKQKHFTERVKKRLERIRRL